MKILIVTNADIGLYKFRKELLRELVKTNEVFIALPKGEFYEELIEIGCHFIDIEFSRHGTNPIKELKLIFLYARTIKKVKPDIVLTYTIKPNVYAGMVCSALGIPYVANVTGLGTAMSNGGFLQCFTQKLYKLALHNARCVFLQNVDNLKDAKRFGIVKNNYKLLPGSGVNLKYFKVKNYPEDNQHIRFLFVGRLMKDKGLGEFISAASIVRARVPATAFDLIGAKEDFSDQILEDVLKSGLINWHGTQKDVRPFIERSHCLVLPSYHEGTANVLLEAAASGRPVITTRIPGCQETFEEGITGLGCEVRDAQSLADAMLTFINLPWEKRRDMGLAGRIKMEREYDRQIVIDAYLEIIQHIQLKGTLGRR